MIKLFCAGIPKRKIPRYPCSKNLSKSQPVWIGYRAQGGRIITWPLGLRMGVYNSLINREIRTRLCRRHMLEQLICICHFLTLLRSQPSDGETTDQPQYQPEKTEKSKSGQNPANHDPLSSKAKPLSIPSSGAPKEIRSSSAWATASILSKFKLERSWSPGRPTMGLFCRQIEIPLII